MDGPQQWGRLARKGAGTMRPKADGTRWSEPMDHAKKGPRVDDAADEWVRVDDVADEARRAVGRGGTVRRPESGGAEVDAELAGRELRAALGSGGAPKAEKKIEQAARSFSRGYNEEARRILKPLVQQAPGAALVRELYGLSLYRLGRWAEAIVELEAFRTLTGSTEQHPVLADCYRAVGDYEQVRRLWADLREASPSAELVTEGRIVAAGALADQDRLADAIRTLSDGWRFPKRPQEHHLRRAYALADLYERAGDVPRARELFRRVATADPGFGDVARRIRALD
jgi:tetratricopeptide (TPR) repeat protein